MSEQVDWALPAPCSKCGETSGYVEQRNGQLVGYCHAGHYVKCVPPADLGRGSRSMRSGSMSVKQRSRVLHRDGHRCWSCGRRAPDVVVHVDHIIPRDAEKLGVSADVIGDDMNLRTLCEECNNGKSDEVSPWLVRCIVELYEAIRQRDTA